jgi:hypothetical protein
MRVKEFGIAIVVMVGLLALTQIPMGFAQNVSNLHGQYLPAVFKAFPTSTSTRTSTATRTNIPTNTLAPTITSIPIMELRNGSFEEGSSGWISVTAGFPVITQQFPSTVRAHSGTWAVWLGGVYDETTAVSQRVTIPADRPYLTYWRWIASSDYCLQDDIAGVSLVNDDGSVTNDEIVDAFELCRNTSTTGWVKRSIDVRQFAGQTRTLFILASTDSLLNSNLFIDDVSFQASPGTGSAEPSGSASDEAAAPYENPVPVTSANDLPEGLVEQVRTRLGQ